MGLIPVRQPLLYVLQELGVRCEKLPILQTIRHLHEPLFSPGLENKENEFKSVLLMPSKNDFAGELTEDVTECLHVSGFIKMTRDSFVQISNLIKS